MPLAEHALGVGDEVSVHLRARLAAPVARERNLGALLDPLGVLVAVLDLALEEEHVRRHRRPRVLLECVAGEPERAEQPGPLRNPLAHRRRFLVERALRRDQGGDTAGPEERDRAAHEVVVDLLSARVRDAVLSVRDGVVPERHVADHDVEGARREREGDVLKSALAHVSARVQRPAHGGRHGVKLDGDHAVHDRVRLVERDGSEEDACAGARLQNARRAQRPVTHAEERAPDGASDLDARVVRVQRRVLHSAQRGGYGSRRRERVEAHVLAVHVGGDLDAERAEEPDGRTAVPAKRVPPNLRVAPSRVAGERRALRLCSLALLRLYASERADSGQVRLVLLRGAHLRQRLRRVVRHEEHDTRRHRASQLFLLDFRVKSG